MRERVYAVGGKIVFDSKKGKGTTVSITFPLDAA
jgi:signal transduction histidine kinase